MSLLPLTDVEEHSYINKCSKFVAFYGRFQSTASRVKPLLIQLENRIDKSYE